jgi:hypothetical protein
MGASEAAVGAFESVGFHSSRTPRETLESAARRLPDSALKAAILATLADREPTPREALAWIAVLQTQRRNFG